MLAIRLARTGKKHQAYFRVVVSDSKKQPTAKFVEILGNYDPHAHKFQINEERLAYYLGNGAQPSNSVAKLLTREKIEMPKWVKVAERNRAPKKVVEEKPAAAPATEDKPAEEVASAEESTEAPVEEAATEATEEKAEETPAKDSEPAEAEEIKEEAK